MAGLLVKIGLSVVILLAVFFQVVLKDKVWLAFGIGRTTEPLTNFPFTCRRIADPRLEACEDMWLSETTRQLFLACSDPNTRSSWFPNVAKYNLTGRSQKDAIVALDLDPPAGEPFQFRELKMPGYTGTAGDGLLSVVGITGLDYPDEDRVELYFTNNRPSVNSETGELLDQASVGANATIELFETGPHATEMKHIHTYADQHISTPNGIAAFSSKSFYVSNDHGPHKLGLRHHLSPLVKNGNVVFCQKHGDCKPVATGLNFPNGLTQGRDGLIYVPDSMTGHIKVFQIAQDNTLEMVAEIDTGYSIDNLAVDSHGDVWVAAFPVGVAVFQANADPYNAHLPTAALRIRKTDDGYAVDKVIEDGHGEVLPLSTTVIHDAATGRLFFSSVISPFIAVCEPNGAQS